MEMMSECAKSFSRIEEKIDRLTEAVNELVTAWPYISRRVERLEKHLYGNGTPGLLVKVNALIYGMVALTTIAGVMIGEIVLKVLGV